MLYYRTHASRAGESPPEMVGWTPPHAGVQLSEQVIGESRVLAAVPPFVFAAPETGWTKLCQGWEVANVGVFTPLWHAKMSSKFPCAPIEVDGATWLIPRVLNESGTRAFKVVYGGPDFAPRLTLEQQDALDIAREIRTCHDAGVWPEMPVKATWAARLLGLTYHLSPTTIGIVGIPEDLIDAVLGIAGGYRGLDNG